VALNRSAPTFVNEAGSEPLYYVNPDPDGNGIAYNGKPVYTVAQAAETLTRNGAVWPISGNGNITYSFLDKAPGGLYNNPHETYLGSLTEGFAPFTAGQRAAARNAINLWDDVVAVDFVEKNGKGADILFMNSSTAAAQAAAFTPFLNGGNGKYYKVQGDLYVNQETADNFDLYYGGYGQTTLVHEIGHTIGLEHPGDYNFGDDGPDPGTDPDPITYAGDAFYFQDSTQYSIMSYFHAGNTGTKGFVNWLTGGYAQTPQTPMVHDIAAAQLLYGAETTTRTGNTVYGFNSTANRDVFDFTVNIDPFLAIWDAGGHDTLDLSGWTRNSVLDLAEGGFSSGFGLVLTAAHVTALNAMYGTPFTLANWNSIFNGQTTNPGYLSDNISIAYGTIIEDGRTGSGNDDLFGNQAANRLNGGAGQDDYTGRGGNDVFEFSHTSTIGLRDRIFDWTPGADKIDVSDLIAQSAFSFVGSGAFTGTAGQVRYAGGMLTGDINGDAIADFYIEIIGGAPVIVSDFVF
jgi:serralysin